jgi:phenylpropionate dioxygenase-like ring-hydroxylating dioxygenase large terminal subunit
MNRNTELQILTEIAKRVRSSQNKSYNPFSRIPVEKYFSEEIARQEQKYIFRKQWLMVGRCSSLSQPGSFFTRLISGIPLLVVKQSDGSFQAFYNVCRHRGSALRSESCGTSKNLHCPFHGWIYDLEGNLVFIPDGEEFPGLDKAQYGLQKIKTEIWGGFIWINCDPDAQPLSEYLEGIIPSFEDDGLETAVLVHESSREYKANWKLGVELFTEAYHSRILHSRTVNPILDHLAWHKTRFGLHTRIILPRRKVIKLVKEIKDENEISAEKISEIAVNMMHSGSLALSKGEWSIRYLSNISYGIFPNLIILMLPTTFITMQFWPLGAGKCTYEYNIYCPKNESYADELFNAERIKNWTDVSAEDTSNLEALQRGVESGAISHTNFGDQENSIPEFHANIDKIIAGNS